MELNCTDRGGNIKADFLFFFFFLNQSIDRYRGGDIQSRRRHLFRFHSKNSQNQIFCHVFFFLFVIVGFHSWDVTLSGRESPKQKDFPLTNESRGSLRGVGGGGGGGGDGGEGQTEWSCLPFVLHYLRQHTLLGRGANMRLNPMCSVKIFCFAWFFFFLNSL